MISYQNSKQILKKGIIKIQNESIKSVNSLNRVTSTNIYSNINYPSGDNAHLMALQLIQMIQKVLKN